MILDAKLIFSEDQAITTVGNHNSTNILDFGVANPNLGEGTKLVLHVEVSEAFASGGSATLTVDVQDSADNSSYASIGIKTGAIAVADLTAGKKILEIPLPYSFRRYMKIVYTVGTADFTAGKVNAYIALV